MKIYFSAARQPGEQDALLLRRAAPVPTMSNWMHNSLCGEFTTSLGRGAGDKGVGPRALSVCHSVDKRIDHRGLF